MGLVPRHHKSAPGSLELTDITLASTSDVEVKSNGSIERQSLSADGAKVAFRSSATNLDPADTDDLPDIYVKNLATGDILLPCWM